MGQRVVVIIIVLALAAGSAFYIYNGQTRVPSPDSGESRVHFSLDQPAAGSGAVEIDFNSIPDVIAEIDAVPIKKDKYVLALKGFQSNAKKFGRKIDKDTLEKVKKDIINNIITTEVLLRQAGAENITIEDSLVEEKLIQVKASFATPEIFQKALKEQGLSEEILRNEIIKASRIQALIEKNIISKIKVSDEEARDYYDLNQLEFEVEEKVRASHILAKVDNDATAEEKEKARKRIEEIQEKLKAGADFTELARTESDDKAAAANDGDLGVFGKKRMVPEFSDAAFTMEPGEISEIIETRFGYHIIKVSERIPPRVIPFEEARERIKARLTQKRSSDKIREYVDLLRKKLNVKILA